MTVLYNYDPIENLVDSTATDWKRVCWYSRIYRDLALDNLVPSRNLVVQEQYL